MGACPACCSAGRRDCSDGRSYPECARCGAAHDTSGGGLKPMALYGFIMLYLMLVLVRPQEYPDWPLAGVPLLPLALVLALTVWLLSRNKRFDAPQYPLLLAFLAVTCLSVLLSGWSGGALQQFSDFAAIVVSFFLLANALDSRERLVGAM